MGIKTNKNKTYELDNFIANLNDTDKKRLDDTINDFEKYVSDKKNITFNETIIYELKLKLVQDILNTKEHTLFEKYNDYKVKFLSPAEIVELLNEVESLLENKINNNKKYLSYLNRITKIKETKKKKKENELQDEINIELENYD